MLDFNSPASSSLDNSSSAAAETSRIGIKLKLKKTSGDQYEVKLMQTSTSFTASVCSSNDNLNSALSDTTNNPDEPKRRPKREASKKIKYDLSEDDEGFSSDEYTPSIKKQKINSKLESRSIRSMSRESSKLFNENKKEFKKSDSNNSNKSQTKKKSPPKDDFVYEPVLLPFYKEDIVSKEIQKKIKIFDKIPVVVAIKSKPFAIALIEEKTNFIYSKAVFFLHLLTSYLSPCIYCPFCCTYMNIKQFLKHFHISDDDVENFHLEKSDIESGDDINGEDYNLNNSFVLTNEKKRVFRRLLKSKYKIQPYKPDGSSLNEEELKTWDIFVNKISKFKKIYLEKQTENDKPVSMVDDKTKIDPKQKIAPKKCSNLNTKLSDDEDDYEFYNDTNDLIISESSANQSMNVSNFKIFVNKEDDLVLSEDDDVQQITIQTASKTAQQTISLNKPTNESVDSPNQAKRTIQMEDYNKVYSGYSEYLQNFISSNQYTICPLSYICYRNSERNIFLNKLEGNNDVLNYDLLRLSLNLNLDLDLDY